jgi:hypothetical protein
VNDTKISTNSLVRKHLNPVLRAKFGQSLLSYSASNLSNQSIRRRA